MCGGSLDLEIRMGICTMAKKPEENSVDSSDKKHQNKHYDIDSQYREYETNPEPATA